MNCYKCDKELSTTDQDRVEIRRTIATFKPYYVSKNSYIYFCYDCFKREAPQDIIEQLEFKEEKPVVITSTWACPSCKQKLVGNNYLDMKAGKMYYCVNCKTVQTKGILI